MKRPWRPKYTRDWRTDPFICSLTLEEEAAYDRLLDIAWDEDGLRSEWLETGAYVAHEMRVSRRKFLRLFTRLRPKFEQISPGIWSNLKLEAIRIEANDQAENARKRAETRWEKHASALRSVQCKSESYTQTHTNTQRTEETPANAGAQSSLELVSPEKRKFPVKPKQSELVSVIDAYCNRWVERFKPSDGKPPLLTKADTGQLVRALKQYGFEQTLEFIWKYLDDPDKWITEQGHPLRHLTSRINSYRATVKPKPHGMAPVSANYTETRLVKL